MYESIQFQVFIFYCIKLFEEPRTQNQIVKCRVKECSPERQPNNSHITFIYHVTSSFASAHLPYMSQLDDYLLNRNQSFQLLFLLLPHSSFLCVHAAIAVRFMNISMEISLNCLKSQVDSVFSTRSGQHNFSWRIIAQFICLSNYLQEK